jgi:hypothetical protein
MTNRRAQRPPREQMSHLRVRFSNSVKSAGDNRFLN